jgi:hypothetical protein
MNQYSPSPNFHDQSEYFPPPDAQDAPYYTDS